MSYREVMKAACDAQLRVESVASSLFGMAKQAKSVDEFLAGCEDAESYIVSDAAGSNKWKGDTLPRCWIQAKSNIAAGMRAGLAPSQYASEKQFRLAKVEHNKAQRKITENESPQRAIGGETVPQGTDVNLADLPMIPDDLRPMVKFLAVLSELARKGLVDDLTKQAKAAHDTHLANTQEGQRRKGNKQKAA